MSLVDVIVLCKDHPEYLTRAIEHLDRQTVDYQGVLVDNSEHGNAARIIAHNAGWIVLDGGAHLNYGQSLNLAIRWTRSPYVMWLSDDAYLADGALQKLLDADKPIVTPLLLNSNGTVNFAGGAFHGWMPYHVGRGGDPADWKDRGTIATDWITTPAALFNRLVLDAIGPVDEAYQWAYEDVDYCLRAAQVGFGAWVCSDALCVHDESGTKTHDTLRSSGERFKAKWAGVLAGDHHR